MGMQPQGANFEISVDSKPISNRDDRAIAIEAAACSLSDISGLARRCSLSLGGWSPKTLARGISTCSGRLGGAADAGRTMEMSPAAPDSFLVIFRFGAADGARAIGATDDAAAVELRGRRRRQPCSKAALTGLRRALSPTFPGWRDGVLYPLAGGRRRLWRGASRPTRAAWVVQRLLAARWRCRRRRRIPFV